MPSIGVLPATVMPARQKRLRLCFIHFDDVSGPDSPSVGMRQIFFILTSLS